MSLGGVSGAYAGPDFPESFLPASHGTSSPGQAEEELVVEKLPDRGKLPAVLQFHQEELPRPVVAIGKPAEMPEEVEGLLADEFLEDYAVSFADAKNRLTTLIAGFEGEKLESAQRLEQLELSAETLHFHLERIDKVQTSGLSRPRLIRELERGLVALDDADKVLELEWGRGVVRQSGVAGAERSSLMQEWLVHGRSFAALQILAFFLPLIIFAIIALILIGTALGWF